MWKPLDGGLLPCVLLMPGCFNHVERELVAGCCVDSLRQRTSPHCAGKRLELVTWGIGTSKKSTKQFVLSRSGGEATVVVVLDDSGGSGVASPACVWTQVCVGTGCEAQLKGTAF